MQKEIFLDKIEKLSRLSVWEGNLFIFPKNDRDEILVALGASSILSIPIGHSDPLSELQLWLDFKSEWAFGILSYDLKNSIESLNTPHSHPALLPLIHFIRPLVVLKLGTTGIEIKQNKSELSTNFITEFIDRESTSEKSTIASIELRPRVSKTEYLNDINALLRHIQIGDIYEVNYCQDFFAEEKITNPFQTWLKLNAITDAPHACFMQSGSLSLMCASPERFICKHENKIISQPIKGTIKRSGNQKEDEFLKKELLTSQKERSENVMIVDLVRNDLSRIAKKGSVKVEELFGIKTFKTVHHMVSTISAEIDSNLSFTEIIKATFPMGSMTGAPKIMAMQLISNYEHIARGWYSGSVGYVEPNGDFDFNVVIRSLVSNSETPYISCSVGSAITIQSDPEKEYEECLLKADAVLQSLRN